MKLGTIWEAWRVAETQTEWLSEAWIEALNQCPSRRKAAKELGIRYHKRDRQRLLFVDAIIDHIAEWDARNGRT